MARNFIITGGTSGIGKAIVQSILLDSDDAADTIIVNYGHNDENAQAFLSSLAQDDRAKVMPIKADLGRRSGLADFVAQLNKRISGAIDALILNVGVGDYKPFPEYTYEDWDRVIETNLTLPIFLVQRLKPKLAQNGSLIFVGSYAGVVPYSSSLVYGVSKAGLLFATKALVKELEDTGTRVNAVAPGFIETAWQEGRSEESRERITAKIALHRFGMPEEVAKAVRALLDNEYINGSVLEVHGGYGYF